MKLLILKQLSCFPGFRKLILATALIATTGLGGCVATTRQSSATALSGSTTATAGISSPTDDAILSVSSSNLSFGSVEVGAATSQLLSLTNQGSANLHISAVSASGNGYSVSGGSGVTLVPNQSVTVSVNFGPTVAGYAAGSLSVASDATNPAVQVSMSGTGITAQVGSHSVTLSWTASTSQVTGYNIYRSTVSGGPYAKVNTAIDLSATYTDSGLASGDYFYVVTSVENGMESGYSNEVAVVIP